MDNACIGPDLYPMVASYSNTPDVGDVSVIGFAAFPNVATVVLEFRASLNFENDCCICNTIFTKCGYIVVCVSYTDVDCYITFEQDCVMLQLDAVHASFGCSCVQ